MSVPELDATRDSEFEKTSDRTDGEQGHFDLEHQHSHAGEPSLSEIPLRLGNLPRISLLAMVRLYQMTFSRTIPSGTCRFYPTCSHYGYQAIVKHGAIKGTGLAVWRVMRCQPFAKGGFDPVP